MKSRKFNITTLTIALASVLFVGLVTPNTAEAHCDRVNGPVATDARKALETGEIDHALIWIGEDQAEELKSTFEQSLAVYREGGKSKELAKRHFMSETVRLHREAEGMPFTGLKPASPAAEDIQVAEKALDTGNLEPVNDMLTEEILKKTQELHNKAVDAQEEKGNSVQAGREWADAYVRYVVYVHKLYNTIKSGPAHGVGE